MAMATVFVGVAFLFVLLSLAALALVGRDRVAAALWRRRNPPEKIAKDREAYLRRVQAPDWPFYEANLQRAVPPALQAWFADASAVSQSYYFGDYYVAFSPIDRLAFDEEWVEPGVMAFALSDGDPLFVRPGANSNDAVFISHHDGGGTTEIAPSVEAFLRGLRVAT
jgi:hypothetical protein